MVKIQAYSKKEHLGYSFILDETFAVLSADKNIKRAVKNEYSISIFYVYRHPEVAWGYTKKREIVEGRLVPKETFINAFFKSRENIEKVKSPDDLFLNFCLFLLILQTTNLSSPTCEKKIKFCLLS